MTKTSAKVEDLFGFVKCFTNVNNQKNKVLWFIDILYFGINNGIRALPKQLRESQQIEFEFWTNFNRILTRFTWLSDSKDRVFFLKCSSQGSYVFSFFRNQNQSESWGLQKPEVKIENQKPSTKIENQNHLFRKIRNKNQSKSLSLFWSSDIQIKSNDPWQLHSTLIESNN